MKKILSGLNRPMNPIEQFFEYLGPEVRDSDSCWSWTGSTNSSGYGQFRHKGVKINAHRFSFELLRGEIPAGLELDHLCRNRRCVNPDHLEPVTSFVNKMRGRSFSALNAAKTHCSRGHAFTPTNTRKRPSGWRECRACRKQTR